MNKFCVLEKGVMHNDLKESLSALVESEQNRVAATAMEKSGMKVSRPPALTVPPPFASPSFIPSQLPISSTADSPNEMD
jgi:hypothetical protein